MKPNKPDGSVEPGRKNFLVTITGSGLPPALQGQKQLDQLLWTGMENSNPNIEKAGYHECI